jgi:4'-phosphopantetheinyl transferase
MAGGATELPPLSTCAVHVWTIALDRLPAERLKLILSPEEVEQASRHRLDVDRSHRVCARGALRLLLGHYLNESPAAIRFGATGHGKPALMWPERPLEFNVAHAAGWALAAFAYSTPLGVDLERIDPRSVDEPLLEAVLTEQEREGLAACNASERTRRFFELWTMKEAWAKADGSGLVRGPASFPVGHPNDGRRPWIVGHVTPLPGFASALAVAASVHPTVELYSLEGHLPGVPVYALTPRADSSTRETFSMSTRQWRSRSWVTDVSSAEPTIGR